MRVAELQGALLDYWVAKADRRGGIIYHKPSFVGDEHYVRIDGGNLGFYSPSTDWSQGGPIIEREKITINPEWFAGNWDETVWMPGETILIAAMRCFVASKYGDEVPDE